MIPINCQTKVNTDRFLLFFPFLLVSSDLNCVSIDFRYLQKAVLIGKQWYMLFFSLYNNKYL